MNPEKNITGIILAGGKSSRMGSDKGLLKLNEKLFVQHIIEAIRPITNSIMIVSSNPAYDAFGIKRVEDIIPESGPIAGLHAGLTYSNTQNNIVVSCDAPLVTTSLLKQLVASNDKDIEVVQFKAEGKTIPLIALYKKRCIQQCSEFLSNREKRLRKLVSALKTKTIAVQQEDLFSVKNINTIEDLKTITYAINH